MRYLVVRCVVLNCNEGPPFSGDAYDVMTHTADGWRIARRRIEMRQRKFFDDGATSNGNDYV